MIAKRDNKHRAVELLKSIFENNFYSQDERRMLSSMGAESTIHSTCQSAPYRDHLVAPLWTH